MSQARALAPSIVAAILIAVLFSIPKTTFAQSVIDLAVHYVEGVPAEDEIAYDVKVYLSVVDGFGNPVKDLTVAALTVTEDSQKVQITNLDFVKGDPINIVLAIDISGSMSGAGITAAKTAASNFISGLGPNDHIAIVTFDESINTHVDFTTDHTAVLNKISGINVVRGAGTCLNDAAYRAVQMVSTLPFGRRAVVLFTDGVDETSSGGVCSTYTSSDVINIASAGGTRSPIYTLGMGGRVDQNTLKRLADLTGGRYLNSPDSTQLDGIFLLLSDQLRSQYVLTYKSLAGPGAHTLAVSVRGVDSQDSDTRNFLLPALPARITFTSPLNGEAVSGIIQVAVTVSGQSEFLAGVTFEINGEAVSTDSTFPYGLELDLAQYPVGNLTLSAIAYGSENAELARSSIVIAHAGAGVGENTESQIFRTDDPVAFPIIYIGIGGLILVLFLVSFLFIRRRRSEILQEEVWAEERPFDYVKTFVGDYGEVDHVAGRSEGVRQDDSFDYAKTFVGDYEDEPLVVSKPEDRKGVFGSLLVESSDDPLMIGHRFEISTVLTTLGRSADNDITFPKDKPVSRHHAEISEKRGSLYLTEAGLTDISGKPISPTFGTFVNDEKVGPALVQLKNGDVIVLGKRVRMKFETSRQPIIDDAVTYDELDSLDDNHGTQG
jgi:VWFA-related protein